jgi:hypothetical protein
MTRKKITRKSTPRRKARPVPPVHVPLPDNLATNRRWLLPQLDLVKAFLLTQETTPAVSSLSNGGAFRGAAMLVGDVRATIQQLFESSEAQWKARGAR